MEHRKRIYSSGTTAEMKKKAHAIWYYGIRIFLSMCLGVFSFSLIYIVLSYEKNVSITAVTNKDTIKSEDSVSVTFEQPILLKWDKTQVSAFPDVPLSFHWEEKNKKIVIKPQSFWKPETVYTVTIKNGRTIFLNKAEYQFTFKTDGYPKVEKFYPFNGEKDVVGDIEDPISVTFDKPIVDYSIHFGVSPQSELSYEINEDSKTIRLLPTTHLQPGKKYTVQVQIKHKKEPSEAFRLVYTSSFETQPPPPETWDKNPEIKLQQALRYTPALVSDKSYIDVNLKQQVMVLFENGKSVDAYLISSGKKGMDTPVGTFRIYNKAPRVWSKKYALFMPYWMAILPLGEVGIHELPEWPGGYKEGANHLGTPVSHGCVRLGVGPAKRVYEWAQVGTTVIVH